jgi:hypothetical protein
MPPRPWEAEFIRLWEAGASQAAIAEALGIPVGTVKSRAHTLQQQGTIQARPRDGAAWAVAEGGHMRRPWIILPLVLWLPVGLFAAQKRKPPQPSIEQVAPTEPSAPTWNEPDEFRGLKFGEDLRQQIPECPSSYTAGRKYYRWTDTKERCWEPMSTARGSEADYWLRNFSSLGRVPAGSLWARQIDNRLSFVSMTVNHDFFDDLRAMLIERYGKPTTQKTTQVQTMAGGIFPNLELHWIGEKMHVECLERPNRIDETLLGIYTREYAAYRTRQRDEQRRQGAEGLSR